MKIAAITRNLSSNCNYYSDFICNLRKISTEITFYQPQFNSIKIEKDVDFIIVCFDILDCGNNKPNVEIINIKKNLYLLL